jgi:hypothetical protein
MCLLQILGVLQEKEGSGILDHSTNWIAPFQIEKPVKSSIAHVLKSYQGAIFALLSAVSFH